MTSVRDIPAQLEPNRVDFFSAVTFRFTILLHTSKTRATSSKKYEYIQLQDSDTRFHSDSPYFDS